MGSIAQVSSEQNSKLRLVTVGASSFYLQTLDFPFNGHASSIPFSKKDQKDMHTAFLSLIEKYVEEKTMKMISPSDILQRMFWPNTKTYILWNHPSSRNINNAVAMLRFYFGGEGNMLPVEKAIRENMSASLGNGQTELLRSNKAIEVGNFFIKNVGGSRRVSKALLSVVYEDIRRDHRFIGATMIAETKLAGLGDYEKFNEYIGSERGSPHEFLYKKHFGLQRELVYEDYKYSGNYSSWMIGSIEEALNIYENDYRQKNSPTKLDYSRLRCEISASVAN